MDYDAIVAGAGIWGCTVARRLVDAGQRVLVIEKRPAVGGNMRCFVDTETGIEVHLYGSHIFHTSNQNVWSFIRRFTDFNGYRHKVLSCLNGRFYHLPFGRTLVREFFGEDLSPDALNEERRTEIFDSFIRGYTSKQWGVPPEQVSPSVIGRFKIRDSDSTDYFDDPFQGIPQDGYNAIFDRLLDHPNISVVCGRTFTLDSKAVLRSGNPIPVYYSGPIDALFGYKFGPLPWRTLTFETERLHNPNYQNCAVVNYPEPTIPFTRIHEYRHYHPDKACRTEQTIITREYPRAWKPGDEPYYPVENPESERLLELYRAELSRHPYITAGGRLGAYRYYDMDDAIASALDVTLRA